MQIKSLLAREILDSRGNPTVRAWLTLDDGSIGVAAVPSGASTGTHEALELRDGDKKRYGGKGVLQAVGNVNRTIAKVVVGKEFATQQDFDKVLLELDGTPNKSALGANAILAVSMAYAVAKARHKKRELFACVRLAAGDKTADWKLPQPMMNVLNGGVHADNGLAIQEFMILPHAATIAERVRIGEEVFHALHALLKEKGLQTGVGDEGGFAPRLAKDEDALQLLVDAITAAGYEPGKDVGLAFDAAASEFYNADSKTYKLTDRLMDGKDLLAFYADLVGRFPIESIEDPFAEDDWKNWEQITKALGKQIRLVGDDLFVTNVARLQEGIERGVANTVLIKLNQIGTVSETLDCIELAKKNNYDVVISHRSGETGDTFMADLCVAVNAGYIKTSCSRSERVEKYNRLMEIEDSL